MPPRKRRPRRAPRCAFRQGNRQCDADGTEHVRAGTMEVVVCRAHMVALNAEAERQRRPGAGLGDVIRGVVNGQPISTESLLGAIGDLLGVGAAQMFGAINEAQHMPPLGGPRPGPRSSSAWSPFVNPHQAPPPPAAEGPDPAAIARARTMFGYDAGDKITEDDLSKRFRKLALKHHPDRKGGSVNKMAEINHARDLLAALV